MGLMAELLPRQGRALVVGGGNVAKRKVRTLVEASFAVTVIAPEIDGEIRAMAGVICIERGYEPGDIAGHMLVFACTDSREANRAVGEAARAAGVLVDVTDSQEESTFFTPAVHRDGALTVAVSTGGASPALARQVLDRMVTALGSGWARRVEAARSERRERLAARGAHSGHDDE